jgi:hypothetical protein
MGSPSSTILNLPSEQSRQQDERVCLLDDYPLGVLLELQEHRKIDSDNWLNPYSPSLMFAGRCFEDPDCPYEEKDRKRRKPVIRMYDPALEDLPLRVPCVFRGGHPRGAGE